MNSWAALVKSSLLLFAGVAAIGSACGKSTESKNQAYYSLAKGSDIKTIAPGIYPAAAANERGDVCVFSQATGEVHFSHSNDCGVTWSTQIKPTSFVPCPSLMAAVEDDGAIDLVGMGQSIAVVSFSRTADFGQTWFKGKVPLHTIPVPAEQIFLRSPSLRSADPPMPPVVEIPGTAWPHVAVAPDKTIYVVYQADTGRNRSNVIYVNISKDSGKSFGEPVALTPEIENCTAPVIAVAEDGAVHITWLQGPDGHSDVYRGEFRFGDNPSHSIYRVTTCGSVLGQAPIACGRDGRTYIVWSDTSIDKDVPDVFCALITKGNRMTTPINISTTPGKATNPKVVADRKGRVVIVWLDDSYGRPAVFSVVSTDNLGDLSYVRDVSAYNEKSGACHNPTVVLSGGRACAVWEQDGVVASPQNRTVNSFTWLVDKVGTGAAFNLNFKSTKKNRVE